MAGGGGTLIVRNRATRSLKLTGREEIDAEGNVRRDDYFYMDGASVFNFTIDRVPDLVNKTLEKNNLTKDDLDYVVFHQANKFMLNTLRKICLIPKEKYFVDIQNTGNTTSSTVPIGLKESITRGNIKSGDKVLVAGFGVGLSWAGTILKFK